MPLSFDFKAVTRWLRWVRTKSESENHPNLCMVSTRTTDVLEYDSSIKPQNLGSRLLKSSQSNFFKLFSDANLVLSYLITTVISNVKTKWKMPSNFCVLLKNLNFIYDLLIG